MRKIFAFHGGVHPPPNKHQSERTPIADAGIPPELVMPLSQHSGAPARPVVSVGERVLKGQMIAAAQGIVSAPLHAPTSGTIRAIEERTIAHPSGLPARCIVIATDGLDEWIAHSGIPDYQALDKAELIEVIRNAGIAGLGGTGFPSAVKLTIEPETRVATLIINATECEPYITADDMLMRERAAHVIEGIRILNHIIAPDEILIGVEDDKPQSIAALSAAAKDTAIEIVAFPARYPSGGEKQLIELLTGKQVPSGGLPAQIGVLCQNVASTVAIFEAVVLGRPLLSRVITVTGDCVGEPQNFQVLLGTPMLYLLAKAGYQPDKDERLIIGGPMMGFTVQDACAPVIKTSNCLLAPSTAELPLPPPAQACIRCGMCAAACPASLLPQQLFWFAQGKELDKLESHNLFDCIECGACSYVCPSNIPLVQYYRAAKAEILQIRHDREIAEQSRIRFEAHQRRLEQAATEKEAKRVARKQAAEQRALTAGAAREDDPVQAAIARVRAKNAAQQSSAAEAGKALETLEKSVVTTHERLATAIAKLDQARTEGSDQVEALQSGIDRTRFKLAAAEQALHEYQQSHRAESAATPPPDIASVVIEKARAARAQQTMLSAAEKARANVDKLQEQRQKFEEMLVQSRISGDAPKVIEALELSVLRLTERIGAAQQQLNQAKDA